MPSDVLNRRPDVQAQAMKVQAMAAKLASAKADLLPHFSLNFLGGAGYLQVDNDLASLKGLSSLVSLDIQLPIFTNGRLEYKVAASDARLKAELASYDKTLLQALAEVDSAYQTQAALQQQTTLLQRALKQASQQAIDTQKLFQYGDKTLDNAINAQFTKLDSQQKFTQAKLQQALNLIGLYKALGGGW